MVCVSRIASTILYWNRFCSCAFAANGCPMRSRSANAPRLTQAINQAIERRTFCTSHLLGSLLRMRHSPIVSCSQIDF
jgi:hypothetical protein